MTQKLTVITDEQGNVLGTQRGHGADGPAREATATLTTGPGQTLHKIEFDIPRLHSGQDIDAFHAQLRDFLHG